MLKDKYENVIVEREDGITWVTLNRPEKRNALSPALHYEMAEIIDELEVDPDTGVMILTGAGDEQPPLDPLATRVQLTERGKLCFRVGVVSGEKGLERLEEQVFDGDRRAR